MTALCLTSTPAHFWLGNKGLMTSHITIERRGEYSRVLQPNYISLLNNGLSVLIFLLFFSLHHHHHKQIQHTHLCTWCIHALINTQIGSGACISTCEDDQRPTKSKLCLPQTHAYTNTRAGCITGCTSRVWWQPPNNREQSSLAICLSHNEGGTAEELVTTNTCKHTHRHTEKKNHPKNKNMSCTDTYTKTHTHI